MSRMSRRDRRAQPTAFVSHTGVPPYIRSGMRMRSGLKRTAFYPVIGPLACDYKLHNSYLKPDRITDPLEEYWAMRTVAGLWDVTGEEAIELAGPDALALLDELVPRDLARLADGRCLYCVMCYDYGGIVEDAVLIRFAADRFWWVGGPGFSEQWIYAHALGRRVSVRSRLDETHVASLQGPRSREILQRVADADLSRLPYYGMVEGRVCGVPAVISRTGYTAELGFDIYVDVESGARLFADLWEAGRRDGVALCGSRALDIRRIEAAILNFGHDFDWQHNPFEIGLGWMVDARKPHFHGREALLRAQEAGPATRLAGLRLEAEEAALVGDRVLVGGRMVGTVTSAVLSPSLAASIAIARLETPASAPGTELTVDLGGRPAKAAVVPMPFFDPERKLSKA